MKKTLRDNKRWFIGLGIGVLAAVIFPQVVRIRFVWNLLSLILVWAIVGMGWNVIGGYCGQVSNGHSLFYGIGAYTVGLAVSYFKISPWISIWIGVGISMLIAFIVGKPLLRLKGHVFAISTMALAECTRIIFINWKWCGGATGVYIYSKGVNGPSCSLKIPLTIIMCSLFLPWLFWFLLNAWINQNFSIICAP